MHEAQFWEKAGEGKVRCSLCRFRCLIADGARGVCGVRENQGGILYSLVYGRSIAGHVDPIEKKPLYHFFPGSNTYSIATAGCNFRCLHCQNYEISQLPQNRHLIVGEDLPPAQVVSRARAAGCRSISYTYTEPTIFFEYAYDCAVLAHGSGLANVFVTNGYITDEALTKIAPYLDAANIDLKGFSEQFYREVTGATLKGVLEGLEAYKRLGIWIEITTLIIPGHNDDQAQLAGIARFIADHLGVETPWHVTAFHPVYRMRENPATPHETLHRARTIGLDAGLKYVYEGNIEGGDNTFCPDCRRVVIERQGFRVKAVHLKKGRCISCQHPLDGVGF